jgi:Zn-dependent peptidase ImmA (M78 family)
LITIKAEYLNGRGVMESTKRWGNIALRGKALRILEDVRSNGNIVNLGKIIDNEGFTYHEFNPNIKDKTSNLLGAVEYNSKRIYVNYEMPANERHFTLAHEIGHIFLHPQENQIDLRVSNPKKSDKESEANVFAYELVMPLFRFIKMYKELNGDVGSLSNVFFVPEKNVKRRVDFLKKQIKAKIIDDFINV